MAAAETDKHTLASGRGRPAAPEMGYWELRRMANLSCVTMRPWAEAAWSGSPLQAVAWASRRCSTTVGVFGCSKTVDLLVVRTRARNPTRWEGRAACYRESERLRPSEGDRACLRIRPDGERSWWSTPEDAMESMTALVYDDPAASEMWIAPMVLRRGEEAL